MTQRLPNTEYPFGEITSDSGNGFVRSSYWGNAARVLQRMDYKIGGRAGWAIEVNVTPINSSFEGAYECLKEVRIRTHLTTERPDRFSDTYCGGAAKITLDKVGEEFYATLFHDDLMAEIDWEQFTVVDRWHWQGGGVPFILVCKEPAKYPHLCQYFLDVMMKDSYWKKHTPMQAIIPLAEAIGYPPTCEGLERDADCK